MVCVSTISQPGVSSKALPFYNRLQQYQQRDCCFFLQIEQFTFAGYRANMGHHRKSDNVLFLSESSKRPTFGVSGVNGGIIRVTPENATQGVLCGRFFRPAKSNKIYYSTFGLKPGFLRSLGIAYPKIRTLRRFYTTSGESDGEEVSWFCE